MIFALLQAARTCARRSTASSSSLPPSSSSSSSSSSWACRHLQQQQQQQHYCNGCVYTMISGRCDKNHKITGELHTRTPHISPTGLVCLALTLGRAIKTRHYARRKWRLPAVPRYKEALRTRYAMAATWRLNTKAIKNWFLFFANFGSARGEGGGRVKKKAELLEIKHRANVMDLVQIKGGGNNNAITIRHLVHNFVERLWARMRIPFNGRVLQIGPTDWLKNPEY